MQHEIDQLDSDLEEDVWTTIANQKDQGMPGAKTAKNLLKRNVKLAVRIKNICFSPDEDFAFTHDYHAEKGLMAHPLSERNVCFKNIHSHLWTGLLIT